MEHLLLIDTNSYDFIGFHTHGVQMGKPDKIEEYNLIQYIQNLYRFFKQFMI